MNKPEEIGQERLIARDREFSSLELKDYDKECLERHIMTVEVNGVEMPIWRVIENLLWVKDQDTDEYVHFKLRFAQKMLYVELLKQALNGRPMRQDVLKARQLGFSTLIAGIIFTVACFRKNTRCIVMADIEEHASNIFEIYQNFYNNLDRSLPCYEEIREFEEEHPKERHPSSLKPEIARKRSGRRLDWKNGSSIQVIVVGENAGRSGSYTMVHSSETAFQPLLKKTNRALFKTVSINNPQSMIFIETTANGFNDYKRMWDEHVSKGGVFNALFVPWFKNPDYTYKVPNGRLPTLEPWIYRKWKQHPEITEEQIMWYWMRYSEDLDVDGTLQEYPWDATDSFISSGKSIFDQKKLTERLDYLMSLGHYWKNGTFSFSYSVSPDGREIEMRNEHFEEVDGGEWRIFSEPKPNTNYCVVCDPTKGFNHDFTAIHVIEQNAGVQCACFNAKVNLEEVAYQIHCVAKMYNNALISVENNTGSVILDNLAKMGNGEHMYIDQSSLGTDLNESFHSRYGHNTNVATRDVYIANFEQAFRENPTIIWDIETLQQMETFQLVQTKTGKMKAMGNSNTVHDDLVMAYAPFWAVRLQGNFSGENQPKQEKQWVIRNNGDYVKYLYEKRKHENNGVKNTLGIHW